MANSLSFRVGSFVAVIVFALFALAALLVDASFETRRSFRMATHSAEVIETAGDALIALSDAESGQRGFVLTRDPAFAQSFDRDVSEAQRNIARVVALTADNPTQTGRARELQRLIVARVAAMREPLKLGQRNDFAAAGKMIALGRGRDLMTQIAVGAQSFLSEERLLQTNRAAMADRRLTWVKQLALVGGPVIAALTALIAWLIIRGIQRPVGVMIAAMNELGGGDRAARVTDRMGSREFTRLARGYNMMAERLEAAVADRGESEERLKCANEELQQSSGTLRERGEVIELLGGMAHRMQAARTDEELAAIIRVFLPRVLPGIPGVLYAHNNSRNLLAPVAEWGDVGDAPESFAPDQCWALRRGRSHAVTQPGCDIVCSHVADSDQVYHCEPLLAGGEVMGVLYLRGVVETERRFRLTVLVENIASALVNHRLQRDLREQTIRDPLTGLFNRRYMEETLALEIARASRSRTPLSLVMCDVDHFKRFNDEFGHDAGDAVLQQVASEMASRFRDGDVVCRFGGEEFTIIAPGTTATALAKRVDIVRRAISELSIRQGGRTLGSTSMSFGIATWQPGMTRDGSSLVQAADAALYQAKREGRNRAVIDLRAAA